jgi:hemerythrin superfamily protein
MTTTATSDIVTLLDADHRRVETELGRYESVAVDHRESYFCELVHLLVAHEIAEEMVVYPAIRSDAPNGEAVSKARIHEQSEAEEKLAAMEKLDATSPTFATQFTELGTAVLEHAQAEEREVFPLLRQVEDEATRQEMGARYEKAKASAPTHPHPHAPDTPPGNKLLGPVAAVFDKARDAAKGA